MDSSPRVLTNRRLSQAVYEGHIRAARRRMSLCKNFLPTQWEILDGEEKAKLVSSEDGSEIVPRDDLGYGGYRPYGRGNGCDSLRSGCVGPQAASRKRMGRGNCERIKLRKSFREKRTDRAYRNDWGVHEVA